MGKSTISMVIFNSFLYVYQAGYISWYIWANNNNSVTWNVVPFWDDFPLYIFNSFLYVYQREMVDYINYI